MSIYHSDLKQEKEKTKSAQKTQGIVKALRSGKLTMEEIAADFNVKLKFIIKFKKDFFFKIGL